MIAGMEILKGCQYTRLITTHLIPTGNLEKQSLELNRIKTTNQNNLYDYRNLTFSQNSNAV